MTQHQSFKSAPRGSVCDSISGLLESAGFACQIFPSATDYLLDHHPSDSCVIAEIRLGDIVRRRPRPPLPAKPEVTETEDAKAWLMLLTAREFSVLIEVAKGNSNKAAARNLGISPRTVEGHRARVMAKLQATSLSDLVRLVVLAGV